MITIKQEFDNIYEFKHYLMQSTWAGAKQRVEDMSIDEMNQLFDYLNEMDCTLTQTGLNDFIWFEWEEFKNEDRPF